MLQLSLENHPVLKQTLDLLTTKGPAPHLHVECQQQTTGNTASHGARCSQIIISSGGGDCAGGRCGERRCRHGGGHGVGGIAAGNSEELSTQRDMLKPIGIFAFGQFDGCYHMVFHVFPQILGGP